MIAMLWIAHKRLRGQPGLALLSAIGIALAVGLAISVPVFAQAVSRAIMEDELQTLSERVGRPALALRIYLLPSSRSPISSQQCLDMAASIAGAYEANLDIPVRSREVTIESVGMMLKTSAEDEFTPAGTLLGNAKVGLVTNIAEHMEIVSGEAMGEAPAGDALSVWMHEAWAMECGAIAGERYVLQPILNPQPIAIRIAGTWLPEDAHDPYWPADPNGNLRSVLLVTPEDYQARVEPHLGNQPVGSVSWAINLDELGFKPELAERYVRGFRRAEVEVRQWLPEARCDVSPLATLEAFLERRQPLTLLLFSFSVPIIGFLLYFLALVANIVVEGQRQATATMVSRGMGTGQMIEASLYEGLILLLAGTPLGVVTGLGIARLMGHTVSFMRFVGHNPLHVSLAGTSIPLILLTMAVTLLARLWPVFRRSRWSIIDYAREAARPPEGSTWLWLYIDLLIIVPTAYAYWQLKQQGTIAILGFKSSGDIFREPLLFLVPVLSMLAASLLAAQLFPLLMRLIDRLIAGRLGLVSCLTLRQLGRQGRQYQSSLLLIMASLSVGVFMASMAASLDRWLVDRTYYRLGADIVFRAEDVAAGQAAWTGASASGTLNAAELSIPWDQLLDIPAVRAGSTVGNYWAEVRVSDKEIVSGTFLALDRVTFPTVAAYRSDFSPAALGELMNRLASRPDGVLVSRGFLEASSRTVGDPLPLKVSADGTTKIELPATIVGVYDYFPTVYEERAPTLVGSLDHLLATAGGVATFDIWLKADLAAMEPEELSLALSRAMNYEVQYQDVRTLISAEQEKKERIGVYGTLSVGFLASLILSGVGLLIQYQKSLRERLFRFATLRAIGLSRRQVIGQVQLEYLLVLLAGVLAGVAIGVQASRLFIPYFRVSTPDGRLPLPPLLLLLDRQSIVAMVAAFAVVQVAAQTGLIRRAMQSQLFSVLRMGSQE